MTETKTRNRDKLLQMALYDMLMMMQANIEKTNQEDIVPCIMDSLGSTDSGKRCRDRNGKCEKCAQDWLNEFPL